MSFLTRSHAKPDYTKPHRSPLAFVTEILLVVLAALLAFLLVSNYVITGFVIPSVSMTNTLKVGDRVLVWRPYQLTGGLQRGQVVVFQDPKEWIAGDTAHNQYVIKRVIGLPGDHVACCNAFGQVEVNGHAINETYLAKGTQPSTTDFDFTVPANGLFVMGDNRGESNDSRYQQPTFVPTDKVIGVALATYWPKLKKLPDSSPVFLGIPKATR
jgi:signal peptidase I